jgi:hypothetical protein
MTQSRASGLNLAAHSRAVTVGDGTDRIKSSMPSIFAKQDLPEQIYL